MTLRQLMCHRSGMIRESPVGGYFDDSAPSLDQTVASVASCVLVYPPDQKTKYSNIGVTLVGAAVERASATSFESYQQQHLLGPMGMSSSTFLLNRRIQPRLARAYLPVAQPQGGFREIACPHFELGILPAGNLYTTAEDLGRFLSFLFAEGRAGDRSLVKPQTLAEMFTPQLTQDTNGFGLGFNVSHFRGHKTVNHTGAVYGFTSSLTAIPRHKLGVIILCNDDIATGPVRRLNSTALGLLLEATLHEPVPPKEPRVVLPTQALGACVGDFESPSWWAKIELGPRGLVANVSGQRLELAPLSSTKFAGNGRVANESPFVFQSEANGPVTGFTALGQTFRRVDPQTDPEVPADWRRFLGSYGPAFIPLIVSVKHGHLYAMTENEFDNRLTPLNRMVFQMPAGLYTDEQLVFQAGRDGQVHSAILANMTLRRR